MRSVGTPPSTGSEQSPSRAVSRTERKLFSAAPLLWSKDQQMRRRGWGRPLWNAIGGFVILLGAWQIVGSVSSSLAFATPVATASALASLTGNGVLPSALADSVSVLYIGLAIGVISGLIIGLVIGRYKIANKIVRPYVNILSSIPGIILIPLCVVWVGIETESQILLVVLITVWPVLLNTAAGMQNAGRKLAELGRSLRLSEGALLRYIFVPATTPYILAGLRISVGAGVVAMIISELELRSNGLGFLLGLYGEQFQTADVLAIVVATSALSLLNIAILSAVTRRWMAWVGKAGWGA